MSTLLLRFAAPLQAWGADSKFNRRGTEREPTKSGVIGFLAAALGIRRDEVGRIQELAKLKFGVRIDQPGELLRDYHTAAHPEDKKLKFVTERYYLADAIFLVGLESEDEALLRQLDAAVNSPTFPLFFGRRSCPPVGRVSLGIRAVPLAEALTKEAWQAAPWYEKKCKEAPIRLTLACDSERPGAVRRRDLPVSFAQTHRKYTFRGVDDRADAVTVQNRQSRAGQATEHDAFAEL